MKRSLLDLAMSRGVAAVAMGAATVVLTAALAVSPANAALIDVTWSGTMSDGNDTRDLFGVPISGGFHDLTGLGFTAAFRFDTTLGSTVTGAGFADLRGGTQFGSGSDASPVVSATLTINGTTVAFQSDQFGGYSRLNNSGQSVIYTEVQDGFGTVDILFFNVNRFDGAIPFGGLTETLSLGLGNPGETLQGFFQQFNDDDTLFSSGHMLLASVTIGPVVDAPPIDTPEPATLALLGVGLFGLGLARRRAAGQGRA